MSAIATTASLGATYDAKRGTTFRVWAPTVRGIAVRLVGEDRTTAPMTPAGRGYFETTIEAARPGTLYFYRLNDHADRPDPASRFQPQGVHGPSQVTARDFAWTDAAWRGRAWKDFVIYEVHVGTFSPAGTFAAIIEALDELAELGITAIQLMPVAQFPGARNWGYDGVHPFAPQNTYGGPEGLKSLVDACHARQLAVILDVVYNHLGPEGNYLSEFGPYFTDRYKTPWGAAINFDGPDSDAVRDYFTSNARYWLEEFHIDGFRFDATHAIFDRSARPFLRELAASVHQHGNKLGRAAYTIAENNANDPRIVQADAMGGYGHDAQILDDFQRSLHALVSGERAGFYSDFGELEHFAKAFRAGFVLSGQYSNYRKCAWGADASALPADKFVCYAQSHDTVGNRVQGERLGRLVDFESLKLVAAATILSPCIPSLFMGEEYDERAPFHYFTSHLDAELAAAVRAGRAREFARFQWMSPPPDPQSEETFARSLLDRSQAHVGRHAVLRRLYRELLRLRREWPELVQPLREQQDIVFLAERCMLLARTQAKQGWLYLCLHFGREARELPATYLSRAAGTILLDTSDPGWGGAVPTTPDLRLAETGFLLQPRSCLLIASGG